jgi:hypothetical protein
LSITGKEQPYLEHRLALIASLEKISILDKKKQKERSKIEMMINNWGINNKSKK